MDEHHLDNRKDALQTAIPKPSESSAAAVMPGERLKDRIATRKSWTSMFAASRFFQSTGNACASMAKFIADDGVPRATWSDRPGSVGAPEARNVRGPFANA
jgi:hypothetical protein